MNIRIFKHLLVCFVFSNPSFADNTNLLVVYPEPSKGQEEVYSDIIAGIANETGQLKQLELKEDQTDIQQPLDEIRPFKIIALGKKAAAITSKTAESKSGRP